MFILGLCGRFQHLMGISLLCTQLLNPVTHTMTSQGCASLNHMNNPHPRIPFLKGMIFSCVISTTFNLSCVNMIGWPMLCIFFTYWISSYFSSFCSTSTLPYLRDCVIPYKWFLSDVTGTPNILLVVWIFEPPSITSIAKTRDASF